MTDPLTVESLIRACGLSNREAAEFCGVTDRTVSRWLAGERAPLPEALARLESLDAALTRSAAEAARLWREKGAAAAVEFAVPRSDASAKRRGWPFRSVVFALLSRLRGAMPEAKIVPVPEEKSRAPIPPAALTPPE